MVEPTENKIIKAIKEVRELFNEVRNNFSQEEAKKIKKNCIKRKLFIKYYQKKTI